LQKSQKTLACESWNLDPKGENFTGLVVMGVGLIGMITLMEMNMFILMQLRENGHLFGS